MLNAEGGHMDITLLVCSICRGARWVCAEHPLPWHLGHQHCGSHGAPCSSCNQGPEFAPWSVNCLGCTTPENFTASNPDDDDVILAFLELAFQTLVTIFLTREDIPMTGPPTTTRLALIEVYFREKLERCAAVALPLNRQRFEAETDDDPSLLHKPYGWMPPYERQPHGPFIFPYCPEIIYDQTCLLSDDELQNLLETLGFIASMHIQHIDRPLEDRDRLIDRTLYDIGPGSMALLSRVQMQAMDAMKEGA